MKEVTDFFRCVLKQNFFDCSAVENVLTLIKESTADRRETDRPAIIIKSTVPVGCTAHIREKTGMDNILFSPEFLRKSKALYDNLYPSRIISGCDDNTKEAAQIIEKYNYFVSITVYLHKFR